ncbi:MAG: hypothetical protein V2A71_00760 [Candidatus Eisenbacteria bacterium]
MRGFAKVSVAALLLVLGVVVASSVALSDTPAVEVTARLYYLGGSPGNEMYRFDYTVDNISLEPAVAGFIVFFDQEGFNYTDYVSHSYPEGWEENFVTPEGPDGSWNVEWDELSGLYRILPGEAKNAFSVVFMWYNPTAPPGPQHFEAWNGFPYEGTTTVIPGGQTGTELSSWGKIKGLFK